MCHRPLNRIKSIIGLRRGYRDCVAVSAVLLKDHSPFIADTQINTHPDTQELVEIARLSAQSRQYNSDRPPNPAMLSHSNFGGSESPEAVK